MLNKFKVWVLPGVELVFAKIVEDKFNEVFD
jgi:hypothetical protein